MLSKICRQNSAFIPALLKCSRMWPNTLSVLWWHGQWCSVSGLPLQNSVVELSFSESWLFVKSVCHVWQHPPKGHRLGHQGNRGGQEQELRGGLEVDQDHGACVNFTLTLLRLYEHAVEYFLHAIKYEAQSDKAKVGKKERNINCFKSIRIVDCWFVDLSVSFTLLGIHPCKM